MTKKRYLIFSIAMISFWSGITASIGWESDGYSFNGVFSFIITVMCVCLWAGVSLVGMHKLKPLSPLWKKITVGAGIILLIPGTLIFITLMGITLFAFINP